MLKSVILGGLMVYQAASGAELERAVLYDSVVPAGTSLPIYDQGYLMFTYGPGDSAFSAYGPDGLRIFDTLVRRPGAASLSLGNSAADTDGNIAVTLGYSNESGGHSGGIALFNRIGRQIRFIDTGRFMPTQVAFDGDHAIWALGWQRDAKRNDFADSQDYTILRKYSREGQVIGSYIPRSVFPPGLEPGTTAIGQKCLTVARDRVGALVSSGRVADMQEWVEIDLNGKLTGRWRMDHLQAANLALTWSGVLYSHTPGAKGHPGHLTAFNRGDGSWQDAGGAVELGWVMMGADGDEVVFWDEGAPPMLLRYVAVKP